MKVLLNLTTMALMMTMVSLQAQISDPGNMMSYRGNNYTTYSIQIDLRSAPSGSVWGGCSPSSGVYTDDSNIKRAAVHWYGLATGYFYNINVRILPGLSSYGGCTANGVTTSSYTSWGGSYDFQGVTATIPAPPAGLSCSTPNSNTINVSWSAASGASYYYYQIQTSSTFAGWGGGIYNSYTSGTSFSYASLSPGTTYYVFVASVNASWQWAVTTQCSCTTPSVCTTPGTPGSLNASPTGTGTANLSWSAGSPAGSATVTYYYDVYTSGGSYITGNSTTSTAASVSGLSSNSSYYFKVRAYTSCNGTYSSWSSNSANFLTFPDAPSSVSSSESGMIMPGTSVTLSASGIIGTVYWFNSGCGSGSIGSGSSIVVNPSVTTTYYAKNNNGNYSPACASKTVTVSGLPVSLLSFNAYCMDRFIRLEWSTASEINNCCFTIQKSFDGVNYEFVSEVSGAGNSNEIVHYYWIDSTQHASYYRLLQTDYDGTETLYGPVWENCEKENSTEEAVIFPNPFEGQISISIPNEAGFDIMALLYDHFGRLVLSRAMKSVETNVFIIETDDACLQPGAYELLIIAGEHVYRRILIKK